MTVVLPEPDLTTKEPQAQLRGAAMWLIGTFAVIGAGLFTSLSLGALNNTTDSRLSLVLAVGGFLVATIGLMVAILSAAAMLPPSRFGEAELARDAAQSKNIPLGDFGPYPSLRDVYVTRNGISRRWLQMTRTERVQQGAKYAECKAILSTYAADQAINLLQRRYDRAQKWIVGGAAAVLVGGMTYAISTATDVTRMRLTREDAALQMQTTYADKLKKLDDLEASLGVEKASLKLRSAAWQTLFDGSPTAANGVGIASSGLKTSNTLNSASKTAKSLLEQRVELVERLLKKLGQDQQAVSLAALTAFDFGVDGPDGADIQSASVTWMPSDSIGKCPGKQPIPVVLQRLSFTSAGPGEPPTIPTARIVTLGTTCPGHTLNVNGTDGSLRVRQAEYVLGSGITASIFPPIDAQVATQNAPKH